MEVEEGWDEGAWNDCDVEGGDSGSFARGWHGNITRGLPHRGAQSLLPWVGEFRVVMDWEGGRVHLWCCGCALFAFVVRWCGWTGQG